MSEQGSAKKLMEIADKIYINEMQMYPIGAVAARFAVVANNEQYRYDQVIRNVNQVIQQKAQRDPQGTITAKEISTIHDQFAGLSESAFKKIFADLLPEIIPGQEYKSSAESMRADYVDGVRDLSDSEVTHEVTEYDIADNFQESLAQIDLDIKKVASFYDEKMINQGQKVVQCEFAISGRPDTSVQLAFGSNSALIYKAALTTQTGRQQVVVPIEVANGQVMLPSVFASTKKVYPFNKVGFEQFETDLQDVAYDKQSDSLDRARHNAFTSDFRELGNQAELEVDEREEITPRVSMPEPLIEVEAILEDAILRKESQFDNMYIEKAGRIVRTDLANLGFNQVALRFARDVKSGMCFNCEIIDQGQKFQVQIPIEVKSGVIMPATVFAGSDQDLLADNAEVFDFSPQGFETFKQSKSENLTPVRYSGEILDTTYNGLRKIVHKATIDRKYDRANEALNLIQDKFGSEAHKATMSDYQDWLQVSASDFQTRCGGCPFYSPKVKAQGKVASTHSEDHCLLLGTACRGVIKKASGVCVKANVEFDETRDESYEGQIMTNQIALT